MRPGLPGPRLPVPHTGSMEEPEPGPAPPPEPELAPPGPGAAAPPDPAPLLGTAKIRRRLPQVPRQDQMAAVLSAATSVSGRSSGGGRGNRGGGRGNGGEGQGNGGERRDAGDGQDGSRGTEAELALR